MNKIDKILTGSKTTTISNQRQAQYFLQGTEIKEIGILRSGLPILGRNPRYRLVDNSITSSISDKNYFVDVQSVSDAGLGQDVDLYSTYSFAGTLFNSTGVAANSSLWNGQALGPSNWTGYIINGIINLDPDSTSAANSTYTDPNLFAMKKLAVDNAVLAPNYPTGERESVRHDFALNYWLELSKVVFETDLNKQTTIQTAVIDGVLRTDVYFLSGTYKQTPSANVKFPDGKITETISFGLNTENYGYGKEYIDSTPFFDLDKFETISYIENNGPSGMFPVVGSFISYDEKLSYNGVIEPFEIRSKTYGLNTFIEGERQPGSVTGEVIQAQKNNYNPAENDYTSEFYEDVLGRNRVVGTGTNHYDHAISLLEPEYVSDFNKNMYPFVESDNSDLLKSDHGIEIQLLLMDPTVDEGIMPGAHLDMAVGFSGVSGDRINSMNYRGKTRR
mgnify:FL=1